MSLSNTRPVFRMALLAVTAAALVGLLVSVPRGAALSPGQFSPDFTGPTLDGQHVTLSEFRGRNPMVLNFFAEFCPPCHTEFPHLGELDHRYRARGLKVMAVSLDETREAAAMIPTESATRFPVIFDPQGHIAAKYGVQALPHTVVIDRTGRVQAVLVGLDRKELEAAVAQVVR